MINEQFLETIKEFKMLKPKDSVLVGVSGGADSVALLNLLKQYQNEFKINLYVGHLNHKLRPDAEIDQRFVENLSKNMGLTCFTESVDVSVYAEQNKLNIENAGRILRYDFYNRTAKRLGANKICLGHNADDNIETFLMRLLRGAGLKGLTGIPPKRGAIIRPLINIWRRDIDKYIASLKIVPRIDHTNYESKYLRNRVRLKLIPQLKIYNLNIKDILLQTILLLTEDSLYLEKKVSEALKGITGNEKENRIELSMSQLKNLELPLQGHLIRAAIEKVKGNLSELSYSHVHEISRNLYSTESWELHLPDQIFVFGTRSTLTISKEKPKTPGKVSFHYKMNVPGRVKIEECNAMIQATIEDKSVMTNNPSTEEIVYVDYEEVGNELVIRSRRNGDRFYPLGMKGQKKLQDFFVDNKIEKDDRHQIPIIESGGQIVWIAGHRIDERVKVTDKTPKVVKLVYQKL